MTLYRLGCAALVLLLALSCSPSCEALSEVYRFATVPVNTSLRFTRLPNLSFNASVCSLPPSPSSPTLTLRPSQPLQPFLGAGAALTEATAYNFLRLKQRNATAYAHLLTALFASPRNGGIGLSVLRFPITASDMSLPTPGGGWSFDDTAGDVTLSHFTTAYADRYQIPVLRDVMRVGREEGGIDIKLVAAPWSQPAWMKDTGSWNVGTLKNELYDVYAAYFTKVARTFADLGMPFHALTLQNEPQIQNLSYPTGIFSAVNETNLAKRLRPLLTAANLSTLIVGWDFNWDNRVYPVELIDLPDGQRYIDVVSFHCYSGNVSTQAYFHSLHPDKPVYFTECSQTGNERGVEDFQRKLLDNRKLYWGNLGEGWGQTTIHWNLAVDLSLGPHSGGCATCSGVVTVDVPDEGSAYTVLLNVQVYNLAHFTVLLGTGSHLVNSTLVEGGQVGGMGFIREDGIRVAQLINEGKEAVMVTVVEDGVKGACVQVEVEAASIVSLAWLDSATGPHRHERQYSAEVPLVKGREHGLFWE